VLLTELDFATGFLIIGCDVRLMSYLERRHISLIRGCDGLEFRR
jgi:hypothetical protein